MSKDTGGAAFPCEQHETQDGRWNDSFEPGMTLRDYFAAKAMQGVMGSGTSMQIGTDHRKSMLDIAIAIYSMADAMLEARNMGQ